MIWRGKYLQDMVANARVFGFERIGIREGEGRRKEDRTERRGDW
jgi:hypothetical protein